MRRIATIGILGAGLLLTLPMADGTARGGRKARLRPTDIRHAMKPVIPRVNKCAKRARISGSIRAKVTVRGSSGRVKTVILTGHSLSAAVARCVRQAIGSARFKRFRRAAQRFTWPFLFRYGGSGSGTPRKTGRSALPERLSLSQIRVGLHPVRMQIYRCDIKRRVRAMFKVRIKIQGATGRVSAVHFLRSGVPKWLERCIHRAYRTGRFGRFRRASQSVIHNMRLP